MDMTPATLLGRVRRSLQIILQISRPYPEIFFGYPIEEIRMDEVHLSTAASALQRIHDSAPNSRHSEALQWSVWQVAGSATHDTPPLLGLPHWIQENDEEYFSYRSPAVLVALVAVSLRGRYKWQVQYLTTVRALLQRMESSDAPWTQVVVAVFDHINCIYSNEIELLKQTESSLLNLIRRKGLPTNESCWLLSTLSEHCSEWRQQPFSIGICLAILSNHVPKWDDNSYPDNVLLEAVVTLAAMSCSPGGANRLHILTRSREYPWLLRNTRDPALFSNWFEDTPSDYHKQLISLLFLIINALICKYSYPLAVQYLTLITSKSDLALYISALTTIAPVMREDRLSAFIRVLAAPPTQELIPIIRHPTLDEERSFQQELLENYDLQLGPGENPDPNLLAVLFILSKHVPLDTIEELKHVNLELKNPSLRLAARVVARLDIPDGSALSMESLYDHRVHNMIAALSLLRYTQGTVAQYTEFLLLESFLESREVSISSSALEYYMKTAISYPDPPAPSCFLSAAVSAAFNFTLEDHLQWMGWTILDIFVDGFETLPVEWKRSFAEGFFTLSRRQLLKSRGDMGSMTRESEIERVLTWEYFHEEEQEREWTDSEFSGLDWMAMAWSLHLSQHPGRRVESSGQGRAKSRNLSDPAVNEEFVLRVLCKLLDAALPHQLTPIIPKLCEFVQWFDDTELSENRRIISTRIEEASSMHREFQKLHCFHKFHCMWYI